MNNVYSFQVLYNRGYDTPVCACTYVEATSYDEAYMYAQTRRLPFERVYSIEQVPTNA